jgi:hypothetical protein
MPAWWGESVSVERLPLRVMTRWMVGERPIHRIAIRNSARGNPARARPPGPWSLAARSPEQKCGWDWEMFLLFYTASYYPLKRATRALWTRCWREVTPVCSVNIW